MLMIFRVNLEYNTEKRRITIGRNIERRKKSDPNLKFSYCTLINQSDNRPEFFAQARRTTKK